MKITTLRNAIEGIPGDLANDVDYALGQRYTQQGDTVDSNCHV